MTTTDTEGRLADVTDSDGDGFDDDMADDDTGAVDTDRDGIRDHRDLDPDGDHMSDLSETGGSDKNGDGEWDDCHRQRTGWARRLSGLASGHPG